MGWWMLFGSVMFVLFWGGLIFLAVWLADQFRGRLSSEDRRPLDIARERYARGEITQEQLQQITENLRKAA
jgi:putative membrane protein